MNRRKFTLLAGLCAATLASGFGNAAVAGKLEDILARGKLIVGTGVGNPPWHFRDEKGDMAGFDVDMAKIVAKGLFGDETKIEFVNQASDARIPNHRHRQGGHHLPVHDGDSRTGPAGELHHSLLPRRRWPDDDGGRQIQIPR